MASGQLKEAWLGQVRAALPPQNLDPVEIREVLVAAAEAGLDPSDLYLSAVRSRPDEYDPAPPLSEVLPKSLMPGEREELMEETDSPEDEEILSNLENGILE